MTEAEAILNFCQFNVFFFFTHAQCIVSEAPSWLESKSRISEARDTQYQKPEIHLSSANSVFALSFAPISRIVPESPRWLASKGRISEAEDILFYIGHQNGKQVTKAQISLSGPNQGVKQDKQYQIMDCFRTPELRKRMLINIFMW